jgi:hypothetical protein
LDGGRKQIGTRKKETGASRREYIEEDRMGVGNRLERVGGSILKKIGRGSRKQIGTRKKETGTNRREYIEDDWMGVGNRLERGRRRLERVGGSILKKIGWGSETDWNE